MEEELAGAFELYSGLFAEKLRLALATKYPYAPGFDGTAYSNGRNNRYSGEANKIANVPKGYNTNLYDSVDVRYDVNNQEVQIFMNDYWQYVNDGRRPGKRPPTGPIVDWLKFRGIQGRDKKGRFATRQSTAFAIATNIAKFGIKPTFFFDIAIEKLSQQIDEELFEQLGASIDDFISQTIINAIPANSQINIRPI